MALNLATFFVAVVPPPLSCIWKPLVVSYMEISPAMDQFIIFLIILVSL